MTLDVPYLDLLGSALGVLLTLLVFSYLLGDHFLVRLVFYGYIGLMAGFAVVIAFNSVLYPLLLQPLIDDPLAGWMQVAVPLLLSGLLCFKVSTRLSRIGNLSLAFLVGVSLAALIGGAIQGTLMPQLSAVISPFDLERSSVAAADRFSGLIEGFLILFGTVATLAYFHFGARPRFSGSARRLEWIEALSWVGQIFIAIALGLIFAGLLRAGFVALVERVQVLLNFVITLQQGF
ncbi:MAG: hypothetical protein DDG59_01575 [Anaerolineae bacterium]|nr:MAG: hypothetical protein DDG59_01575 [Anaerolineae bacterium]